MQSFFRCWLTLALVSMLGTQTSFAENWPHWRGDLGNSVSLTATPPTEWSQTKNVKWKVAIPGSGSGSPVIWENQVFVVTAIPAGPSQGRLPKLDFQIHSYDRNSGGLLWKQSAVIATPHEGTHSTNGFASASPCTDGRYVYAHFGSRGLYCYTLFGELVWKRDDLGQMRARNNFGEGSSPTIEGDFILVPWDHEGQSHLFAFNKHNGKTVWKIDRDEPTGWATPLVVEHNGSKQIIMNGQNYARAYDLETGKELWKCGGQTQRPVASPVQMDDMVFVGSGFRGAYLGAFKLGGKGDIAGTDQVQWEIHRDTPDIGSLCLSENRLYFYKAKKGILTCVDAATGKVLMPTTRIPGLGNIYASPVAAAGNVYLSDRDGNTVVIKDTGSLDVVATNSIGETIDATPALVDNQLFIRGEKHLFCIEE